MIFDWWFICDNIINEIVFIFGDNVLLLIIGDGEWEGFGVWFYMLGKYNQFDYVYIDWILDLWNDNLLDNVFWYCFDLGNNVYFEIWDFEVGNINELLGIVIFCW